MNARVKKSKGSGTEGRSRLELQLHASGMTLLPRAGLGGLAATLKAMERRHKLGRLRDDQLPAGPDLGTGYPWLVGPTSIVLDWGEPKAARQYLRKLFAFAFGIKDKLIDLPGTYRDELSRVVRAELQLGLSLTFLQHGNTRSLGDPSIEFIDPTGDGVERVAVEWRPCASYKHQDGADELTGKTGQLKENLLRVEGPLYPGAAVRHKGDVTKMEDSVSGVLALYFAPIGCLSLPVRKSVGVLLVPDVSNLDEFARARPRMTPTTSRESRIASLGDAALQAMMRLRGKRLIKRHRDIAVDRIYVARLSPQPWDNKQKYRDAAMYVLPMGSDSWEECRLRKFEVALAHLPRRISRTERDREHDVGRGRDAKRKQRTVKVRTREQTWWDSVVRPLIADNLACGRSWYDGFAKLMTDREDRRLLKYELKGLQAMADEPDLLDDTEMKFVYAFHRAIHMARGKIYAETMGAHAAKQHKTASPSTKNRWERLMQRVRLDLVGAKTQSQTQSAIAEILARTGTVQELRDDNVLCDVKRMLFSQDWQRVRNLALFALASYKRPPDLDALPGDVEDSSDSDVTNHINEE